MQRAARACPPWRRAAPAAAPRPAQRLLQRTLAAAGHNASQRSAAGSARRRSRRRIINQANRPRCARVIAAIAATRAPHLEGDGIPDQLVQLVPVVQRPAWLGSRQCRRRRRGGGRLGRVSP
jgi:hypothetical protein